MYNVFAGAFVDRINERRKDPDWLADAVASPDSLFLPVVGDRCLVNAEQSRCCLLGHADVDGHFDPEDAIFLGLFRDRPTFAFATQAADAFAQQGEFQDLRFIGTALPPDEANLAAHARALVLWHRSQVFCGHCGHRARAQDGGNTRRCSNPDCGRSLFPRVDPAIIVLVSRGDRCLLGRQASWPDGRYSTIAGFVEPGESLEDAVRREVYEETNIRVGDVRYHSSQPWPFPSSLMLGFEAEALSDDIELNDGELEDARWFTRQELLSDDLPKLPFRISIARRLVDHWLGKKDDAACA